MSFEASNAVWVLAPRFPVLLREHVPVRRRPDPVVAFVVALELADHYRDSRGYVDDTAGQIAVRVGELITARTVKTALQALEGIGVWVRVGGGNRFGAARRAPGPLLECVLERRADPSLYTGSRGTGTGSRGTGSDPLEGRVETSRGTGQPVTSTSPRISTSPPSYVSSSGYISSRVPVSEVEEEKKLRRRDGDRGGDAIRIGDALDELINNFRVEDDDL